MQVVIRADASTQIGIGHVMRCLTFANKLRSYMADVIFICRELTGHICDVIEAQGFRVIKLPNVGLFQLESEDNPPHSSWLEADPMVDARQTLEYLKQLVPDWLIIDHYALDERWETLMRSYVKHIMVIDDLADRIHNCDLLLDQNLYEKADERYRGLIPDHCRTFFGPRYALLREEFSNIKQRKERDGIVNRILVFFGGSDPDNVTMLTIRAILSLNLSNIHVDIVAGSSNPNKGSIAECCLELQNFQFHCQINNMAELMSKSDLAIGAGGTATWERCSVGLPAITIVMAKNQWEIACMVAKQGAIWNLGYHYDVDVEKIAQAIRYTLTHPSAVRQTSINALSLMSDNEANGKNILIATMLKGF
ncbi:UDP-2,4-diacetamido-2,4,6-trideoxy-beta-L-altropyranose hydrolase [Paenibacillus sp. SI8]|uniref:UDP-2,4-diacetamido-2,4, 6-trideoxy-beta-L-altropyranose hydrolase n=1 Tax=unclassified Paenibacillus TaxID=185978 RepID=UPI0034650038